jgi:glycosyltransferase involved in cell wall biosynthesis
MAIPNKERLNWLIIEDGLKDFHGHFLDFVTTFVRGLTSLGDQVTVLCARGASDTVVEQTGALPLMPEARWRSGSLRNPLNILKSIYWIGASLIVLLRNNRLIDQSDLIFLTAAKLQHLILWRIYSALRGQRFQASLLLFFMATPVTKKTGGAGYEWEGFLGRALGALVKSLGFGSGGKRIRFATETEQLSDCLSALSGVPFETLPQPVEADGVRLAASRAKNDNPITIGSFGPPREEKGSHLLIKAIAQLVANHQLSDARFIVQWTDDFVCENGEMASIPTELHKSDRFRAITHYFAPGEYENLLKETDAIVLPYGSNYDLRGSRVVIDALVRGLPVAVPKRSSMQTLAQRYGSCVLINEWNESSISAAIKGLVDAVLQKSAENQKWEVSAREYFSVKNFRALVLSVFTHAPRQS